MRASRCGLVIALAYLASFAAAQQSDRVIAERILGPQWKQMSRRAGMIFVGTVLNAAAQTVTTDRATPGATPAVQLSFRVEEAIAGVDRGQILTIHEWAGAWSMHRPMSKGQHVLIFLYPLSRLGFTSPVGGSLGQVALDPSGENVIERKPAAIGVRNTSSTQPRRPLATAILVQLERAIRRARSEEE